LVAAAVDHRARRDGQDQPERAVDAGVLDARIPPAVGQYADFDSSVVIEPHPVAGGQLPQSLP
jgi:hypothetical protein